MAVGWVDVLLDRLRADADEAASFWAQVTGGALSAWREDHTFVTVVPAQGDDHVRLQAVATLRRRGGGHLDLCVADAVAEASRLRGLGAHVLHEDRTLVLLRSPAGIPFCLTARAVPGGGRRPGPVGDPPARLDQVTLDVPASAFDAEAEFWASTTGWELLGGSAGEFLVLRPPGWGRAPEPGTGLQVGPPVRLLLQRLDEQDGPAGLHVDLACADRVATAARHEELGATVHGQGRRWTVMHDPSGAPYCLTDRDPRTGVPPARP